MKKRKKSRIDGEGGIGCYQIPLPSDAPTMMMRDMMKRDPVIQTDRNVDDDVMMMTMMQQK